MPNGDSVKSDPVGIAPAALHVALQYRNEGKDAVTKVRAGVMIDELLAGLVEEKQSAQILTLEKPKPETLETGETNEALPRAPVE